MIKFNLFNVTNTETGAKAKIHYSHCILVNGKECVTLYEKSYESNLTKVFGQAENDSDIMTDYMEKDRVRIYPDSEHWATVMEMVKRIKDKNATKFAKKYGKAA